MPYQTIALCGTTTIITFIFLGPLCLLLAIILAIYYKKIVSKLFIMIEIILILLFLIYTINYTIYECKPSSGGGKYIEYEYQLLPNGISPYQVL